MTRIDLELIGVVYGLYANDCIHWLKEDDVAYTRKLSGEWRQWKHNVRSFTLLRRRPCVVNPLPFVAGFACAKEAQLSDQQAAAILSELDRLVTQSTAWLRGATSAEAVVMLLVVPVMFVTQVVHYAWLPLLALILMSHAATAVLFYRHVRKWEGSKQDRVSDMLAICVNPLSAIRCGDVLERRAFEALLKKRGGD
jgi:hypothetical protein